MSGAILSPSMQMLYSKNASEMLRKLTRPWKHFVRKSTIQDSVCTFTLHSWKHLHLHLHFVNQLVCVYGIETYRTKRKWAGENERKLFEMKYLNATLCVSCDTDLQTNTYGCRCEFVSQAHKLCRKDSLNIKISFIFDVVSGQNCNIDSKWKIYIHDTQ